MTVASTRYGTIRRPTAWTTDAFDGFSRHVASADSTAGTVIASISGLPAVAGFEAPPGSEQRIAGSRRSTGPDTFGSFVVSEPHGTPRRPVPVTGLSARRRRPGGSCSHEECAAGPARIMSVTKPLHAARPSLQPA